MARKYSIAGEYDVKISQRGIILICSRIYKTAIKKVVGRRRLLGTTEHSIWYS
jgi:hypothetical protein